MCPPKLAQLECDNALATMLRWYPSHPSYTAISDSGFAVIVRIPPKRI